MMQQYPHNCRHNECHHDIKQSCRLESLLERNILHKKCRIFSIPRKPSNKMFLGKCSLTYDPSIYINLSHMTTHTRTKVIIIAIENILSYIAHIQISTVNYPKHSYLTSKSIKFSKDLF